MYSRGKTTTNNKDLSNAIGTAWLVLSHGSWFAASIGASAIAQSVLKTDSVDVSIGIGWAAIALVMELWTFYAIYTTYKASISLERTVFGSEAFFFLMIMNDATTGITIWTLVLVSDFI